MSRKFILSLMLGTSLLAPTLLTGCATTAKGVSSSAMKSSSSAQSYRNTAPKGTTLAVVRYPAYVEADAQDDFYKAFRTQSIGGNAGQYFPGSGTVQGLADSLILKSNYFALSLYKELAAKLPNHTVLLSPHVIKKGANGKLTSEPMTQAESLGNVLTVDFVSYTFPDSKKMMGKEPLSFGDLVTPLVTVKTDHRAAVPTQGLLLATRPLIARAAAGGRTQINAELTALQNGRLETKAPELDFITYLRGERSFNVAQKPLGKNRGAQAVQSYGLEKVKLDPAAITALSTQKAGTVDPLEHAFSKAFANEIIAMLNNTDIAKASMAGRAGAIAQFDESLAALTMVGSNDPAYVARLRYAERLLEAEKNYLSVQSLRLFDGVHNGEMGAQVLDMLSAEYRILEKRRRLARKQNTATALSILGAVAAGAAIANQDRNSSFGERVAIDALIRGAIFAGTKAYSTHQRSKAVTANYLASVAPALEEQTSIQVSLIDSNETITAIRFDDLKQKLQTLYTKNQRSLDTVATRCGYRHTGSTKTGTWLGVCSGGLGAGPGVGVLRNPDGSAVEYYGYAQAGQPNGPGYMIFHGASESYAMEGNFSAGIANGVMRVSRAGEADKIRTFRAGQDVGSASAQSVASPFSGAAPRVVRPQMIAPQVAPRIAPKIAPRAR